MKSLQETERLWRDLKSDYDRYIDSRIDFIRTPSALQVIHDALEKAKERALALDIISVLPQEDRKLYFRQLVSLASYVHGFTEACRNLILSMPHEWLMNNIDQELDLILEDGDYEEYRCLLELCSQLDKDLMLKIATRALDNSDKDIKEAGADYMPDCQPGMDE